MTDTNLNGPIAYVDGKPLREVPTGLYIPPEALEVFLDKFSGPLDLLLYLIRRHSIDIISVNIAEIATQYIEYIRVMKQFKMQLAAEYLVMAAILAEIKSRTLLPRSEEEEEATADSAERLIEKLKEYERIRDQSELLDAIPRLDRDFFFPFVRFTVPIALSEEDNKKLPSKEELAEYLRKVLIRQRTMKKYEIKFSELSTRERMTSILEKLKFALGLDGSTIGENGSSVPFDKLFTSDEGRQGAAVSLVALTQLIKERLADATQSSPFGRVYVHAPRSSEGEADDGLHNTDDNTGDADMGDDTGDADTGDDDTGDADAGRR